MFNSAILDVAIGLVFVYLLLSLICSAVNELIEARLKMRASALERGLRELLNDPKGTGLMKQLYDHPLVSGLFQGSYDPGAIGRNNHYAKGSTLPSYIPPRSFALALMDIALPATSSTLSGAADATVGAPIHTGSSPAASGTAAPAASLQTLRATVGSIKNAKVERALMTMIDAAGSDMNKARENIEQWYDSAMDRIAGWYKRRVQWVIFLLGLLVAVAMNADTITLGKSLYTDSAVRGSLVAAAQEFAKTTNLAPQAPSPNPKADIETCRKDENAPECRLAKNVNQIRALGLPVGWNADDLRTVPNTPGEWLLKLLGWFVTALAISLGAPFWFDLLSKFMAVRATMKPREKAPDSAQARQV